MVIFLIIKLRLRIFHSKFFLLLYQVEDIRNKYKKIFDALDTDHDGKLVLANSSALNKHLKVSEDFASQEDWDNNLSLIDQGNNGFGFEEFICTLMMDGQIMSEETSGEQKVQECFYLFASQPGHKQSYADFVKMNRLLKYDIESDEEKVAKIKKAFAPNNTKLVTFAGKTIAVYIIPFHFVALRNGRIL